MPDYRIYQVTADGAFAGPPTEITAENDQAATDIAIRLRTSGLGVEVWCSDRDVFRMPPLKAN